MMELVDSVVAVYSGIKAWLTASTGATEDLLHVHTGLLIFVLAALLLRRKMRSPIPLALVAFFAVLNEVFDWLAGDSHRALEPYVDIANTLFWPTVLFLVARRWR